MRSFRCFVVGTIVVFLSCGPVAFADSPIMPTNIAIKDLFAGVSAAINQLQQFKLNIDANVNVTVDPSIAGNMKLAADGIIAGLNQQMDHLKDLLNNDLSRQVDQLSGAAYDAAIQINSAVQRTNLLLKEQQKSLLTSAQVMLAGLQTVALDVKQTNPLSGRSDPRVYYVTFDGQTPSSFPKAGGNFTVSGYGLWTDFSPTIVVRDDSKELFKIEAKQGPDENSFRGTWPASQVSALAGKCVQMDITAAHKKSFIGIKYGREDFNLVLPVCVPQSFIMQYLLTADIAYDVPKTTESSDPNSHQFFRWDNSACNNAKSVSDQKRWNIGKGCRITDYKVVNAEQTFPDTNIGLSITADDTITASGTISSPKCATVKIPPFGPTIEKLLQVSVFAKDIYPVVKCDDTNTVQAEVTSPTVDVSLPNTQICVDVPKTEATSTTTFWYIVTPVLNGVKGTPIYSSPRTTTNKIGGHSSLAVISDFGFDGVLNPNPVNGKAQVCATITGTT